MGRIKDFVFNILLSMFPQREAALPTDEKVAYEKGGRILRGIKGNKDKMQMAEGMGKRNMGN